MVDLDVYFFKNPIPYLLQPEFDKYDLLIRRESKYRLFIKSVPFKRSIHLYEVLTMQQKVSGSIYLVTYSDSAKPLKNELE